jgi:microcin C transport system substrate-binding protein
MDENGVGYGLLAEDVQVAPDRMSATFRIRPEARFHNGDPVRALDVKHSYETLISKFASPGYATLFADVAGADAIDERTVRFRFKKADRQLPLVVGGIPVFSTKWGMENGKPKQFDQVVMDVPIATGPYKIGPVQFGKDITYVRDPNYWARDLPCARHEQLRPHHRQDLPDNTARLEALKAGEFDLMQLLLGRRLDAPPERQAHRQRRAGQGRVPAPLPYGFYSYVLNTRLPKFQDGACAMALGLAMDYEWMNRQLFTRSYQRVKGLFGNTDCEANGCRARRSWR